jgi:hypothetical protein
MRFIAVLASLVILQQLGCGGGSTGGNNNFDAYQNAKQGGANSQAASHIPLIPKVRDNCTGNKLALYSWGYEVWNGAQSPIVNFLLNPRVTEFSCGEIYINVADYTATNYIRDESALIPFIRNVRATGNHETVFLVYGDVQVSSNGAPEGPTDFAQAFFNWIRRVSDEDLKAMVPLGISYDCEHLSSATIVNALTLARKLKTDLVKTRLGNDDKLITIEWTIEGQKKPKDTDIVMKLADRALMMAYRNHIGKSVRDPGGDDTIMTRLMDFMFTEQCSRCLDDAYATANYRATIKIMLEGDCMCGNSCHKISFCAFDAVEDDWGRKDLNGVVAYSNGAQYLEATLREADRQLHATLTPAQYKRLFGSTRDLSLFAIHNWNWFTCFFNDPTVDITTPIGGKQQTCAKHYHSHARSCRNSK